jgi:hypothetical protein
LALRIIFLGFQVFMLSTAKRGTGFSLPCLLAVVLRSFFIAFAKKSGAAQLALMIVVEIGLVVSHFVLKPSWSRPSHVLSAYLATTRFVCTIMMIAFVEAIKVMAIPRVVIGIVIALIWSVSVLVVTANIVWNIILSIRRRSKSVIIPDSVIPSEPSIVEKGNGGSESSREKSRSVSGESMTSFGHHVDGETHPTSHSLSNDSKPDYNIPSDSTVTTVPDPVTPSQSSGPLASGNEPPTKWTLYSQPYPATPSYDLVPSSPLENEAKDDGWSATTSQRQSVEERGLLAVNST